MTTAATITTINNLVKADLLRLLSKGFSYPDVKSIDEVRDLAHHLLHVDFQDKDFSENLIGIKEHANEDTIRKEYSRVFLSGGLPVSESFCTGRFDCVSDVNAFYNAFGLAPKSGEVPDSISYELEFLALMLVKIEMAPNEESREISLSAINKFYDQHLSDFIIKFSEKINAFNPSPYYSALVALLNNSKMLFEVIIK